MSDINEQIEQLYENAFSKFDKTLIDILRTSEGYLSDYKDALESEQLSKLYITISICKIKMDYPDDVMPMLIEAENLAAKINDNQLLYGCLNVQANSLYRNGNLPEAIQKLINILVTVQSEENKSTILCNLGIIYTSWGMFDKALECLFETLKLYEKAENYKDYARSCLNIAKCYFDMNNVEKSIEYFHIAQKVSNQIMDEDSLMFLKVNLGLAYAHIHEFEKALSLMNEAVDMEKNLRFAKKKGSLIYDLGQVYELCGDYEKALMNYDKSLSIVRTDSNVILLVSVMNSKAGVLIKISKYAEAEELLFRALQISTDSNLQTHKQESLRKLADLFQVKGLYQQALEYFREYHNINETIFNAKVKNGIMKYESEYLTEKIEHKAEIYRLKNVELAEKNAIISQKQKQLEEALADLSESNATKDKLFSIIAHDLRGPVSSLHTALQMILNGYFDKDEQDVMLNQLNEQTKNTYDLLENLLWWAQAQKDGMKLNIKSVMVTPLILCIKEVYRAIAQNKKIKIEMQIEDNLIAYVDSDVFGLIIRNLIGNAVKFAPSETIVGIKGFKQNNLIRIEVSNQGTLINPEIFTAIENKQRIQSLPGTNSEKGTGLGLSLCYEFANKMNGKLYLKQDYHQGTCIIFETPQNK